MYIAILQTTEVTREKSFAVHHNVGKTFAVLFDKNEKYIQLVYTFNGTYKISRGKFRGL